jgi:hypothetical protein
VFCNNQESFLNSNHKKQFKNFTFYIVEKNITFQLAKSDYETQQKNCYQQHIFELTNKEEFQYSIVMNIIKYLLIVINGHKILVKNFVL